MDFQKILWVILSLYKRNKSLVHIAGNRSDLFSVGIGIRQGCPLSLILFIVFMDRISILGMSYRENAAVQTQDSLEKIYFSDGLAMSQLNMS